jgi:cytidylate kinase
MGIIRAQMGVLFRKAEATITGSIMRTWAQKMVLALPSMKFMARSRPDRNRCTDSSSSVARSEAATALLA